MDPGSLSPSFSVPGPGRSERPWGWFETLASGEGYLVKRLRLQPGRRISLQRHQHRCEHWVVVAGEGSIDCDGCRIEAGIGTSVFIPVGGLHRATAGTVALEIIEVQRGTLLSEDDIERFDDDFGRVVTSLNSL